MVVEKEEEKGMALEKEKDMGAEEEVKGRRKRRRCKVKGKVEEFQGIAREGGSLRYEGGGGSVWYGGGGRGAR